MSTTQILATRSERETADEAAARLGRGLFPHQVEGVAFLLGRRRAILADDMGLGKTRQAVVALTHSAPAGPWLVVCPASVKRNWAREIALAVPGAETAIVGPEPAPAPGFRGWLVVNYDILGRQIDALLAHRFAGVVFDEAHYLKNQASQRSRLGARLVESAAPDTPVYALSGTPLTNRPRDLFPLLKVIRHPLGKSFLSFAKRYCAAHHNGFGWVTDGASNLGELAVELRGALLRRVKDEVLDLPPKLRSWLEVEVTGGTAAAEIREVVLEFARSRARQGAGRPGQEAAGDGSPGADRTRLIAKLTRARRKLATAKAKATVDLVEGALAQGEKVLVFSCFDAPVERVAKHFGDRALTLTGKTPTGKRQAIVDRFQEDEGVRVLVANILAGGVGLNLTAARHVVFNDLDWVPANHWQAEDRAYRIGQTGTVNVHYLVGAGTIDEFVRAVLEAKTALAAAVIDGRALEAGAGDVLGELEHLIGALSPGLASLRNADLDEADLRAVIREAAARYRREQGLDAADGEGPPAPLTENAEAALAALAHALAGPAPERYRVVSNSRPGAFYEIEMVEGDALCSCPGFEYRGTCSHARKLKAALGRGGVLPAGYSAAGVSS